MKLIFSIILLWCGIFLHAQQDTVFLDEIVIQDGLEKFLVGARNQVLDIETIKNSSGIGLSEILQANTSIYIRSYGGSGQLSTISFRGTTPSHTSVQWNGIDINSQTLGQSDFSSIPKFALRDVAISQGPNSSLYGNGSIGGRIELNTSLVAPFELGVASEYGSLGRRGIGLNLSKQTGKLSSYMNAYHSSIKNDFGVKFRGESYDQNNAKSRISGFTSGMKYDFSTTKQFLFDAWINIHDRQIQPIMGDRSSNDQLLDQNLRFNAKYRQLIGSSIFEVNAFHIRDKQSYNVDSKFDINRFGGSVSGEWFVNRLTIKSGSSFEHSIPNFETYVKDSDRMMGDVYVLARLDQARNHFTFNIRQSWVTGFNPPMAPSLGYEYDVLKTKALIGSIFIKMSRNYRTPTLNDLYWFPGGNTDLEPEVGISGDVGFTTDFVKETYSIHWSVTHYRSWIDDLIQWIPGGSETGLNRSFYYAENVRSVHIRGFESQFEFSRSKISGRIFKVIGTYSYNKSVNKTRLDDFDRSKNKQMAYVPYHKAGCMLEAKYQRFFVTANYSFIGERFTEANNDRVLDAFSVIDMTIGQWLQFNNQKISISVSANNLANNDYQNYELRATPGRNYLLNLNYQLK